MKTLHQLERVLTVPGSPDHFDGTVATQHFLDDLADVRRIVHEQNAKGSLHEALPT